MKLFYYLIKIINIKLREGTREEQLYQSCEKMIRNLGMRGVELEICIKKNKIVKICKQWRAYEN